MDVGGTWHGEYRFEEAACDKTAVAVVGHVIAFTMELQPGWLGSISGTVKDDERTGYAEPGKIKGRFKGGLLEFRRSQPVLRLMHESGRVTLERWAERRKVVMDTERASPAILFEGQVREEDGKTIVEGEWRMSGETLMVPGSYENLMIPTIGGTWSARRGPA